jgi:sugar/nucleoside kinase (ribokinase family)
VGRVGDDPFGREAVAVLTAAGVVAQVAVDAARATGTVVVLVGADGARTLLPDAGANSALTVDDLPALTSAAAAWLHLSGHTLLNPGSRAAGETALARAAASGVPRSVDVAATAPLEALGGKEFLRMTDGVELAFCTLDEAEVLVGTRDPSTALARLTGTYQEVVLKTDDLGARWAREGAETVHVPPYPPSAPVIDLAGAGDAFAAAYVAAALDGADVRQRLVRASRAAAEAVVRVGARPLRREPDCS